MNGLANVLLVFVGGMIGIVIACVCVMACCQAWFGNDKTEMHTAPSSSITTLQTSSPLLRGAREGESSHSLSLFCSNRTGDRDQLHHTSRFPYPISRITSMAIPSYSVDTTEFNSRNTSLEIVAGCNIPVQVPSASRSNRVEGNESTPLQSSSNINYNIKEEDPPPSYAEAVLITPLIR